MVYYTAHTDFKCRRYSVWCNKSSFTTIWSTIHYTDFKCRRYSVWCNKSSFTTIWSTIHYTDFKCRRYSVWSTTHYIDFKCRSYSVWCNKPSFTTALHATPPTQTSSVKGTVFFFYNPYYHLLLVEYCIVHRNFICRRYIEFIS